MKRLLSLPIYFLTLTLQAQSTTGIADDFKMLAMHNLNVNTSTITSFSNTTTKGSRYLFDQWTPGSVTTLDNITYSDNYLFNYDKINHELYANSSSQGNLTIILDKNMIRTFRLGNMIFLNGKLIDPLGKDIFYQVLVNDTAKLSLYKLNLTRFIKGDPTNVANVRMGNTANEYADNYSYYLTSGKGELRKIKLTESFISKILKDQSTKMEAFFKSRPNQDFDEAMTIDLITFLNL